MNSNGIRWLRQCILFLRESLLTHFAQQRLTPLIANGRNGHEFDGVARLSLHHNPVEGSKIEPYVILTCSKLEMERESSYCCSSACMAACWAKHKELHAPRRQGWAARRPRLGGPGDALGRA